jgi:outer membrane protein OmpA-like peptidoglycan-associated protein
VSIDKTQCIELKVHYEPGEKYSLTIRSDFSVYINNKYHGYNSKVIKFIYKIADESSYKTASGDLYDLDKTMKNGINTGYYIDTVSLCDFSFDQNGKIVESNNNYKFPMISGIPFYSDKKINQGETVDSTGDAIFDLTNELRNIKIPIFCQTTYLGKKIIFSKEYDYFQLNYGFSRKLKNIFANTIANHKIDFYYDAGNKMPAYMIDHFTEEFTAINNEKIKRIGFIDYYYNKIERLNTNKIIQDLRNDKNKNDDLTFEKREDGVAIIINNLRFKPDSTELLDEEKEKLLPLYDMLSKIKDRTFKIIGHTAKYGAEKEQMALSVDRAKAVAMYLIDKGIKAERIMYTGKGATVPVAPNDTEENMQKNRRVEIIIMED